MRDAAANCTAIAHLLIADHREGVKEQGKAATHNLRPFKLRIGRERTDHQSIVGDADISKVSDPPDVDQVFGLRETEFHGW